MQIGRSHTVETVPALAFFSCAIHRLVRLDGYGRARSALFCLVRVQRAALHSRRGTAKSRRQSRHAQLAAASCSSACPLSVVVDIFQVYATAVVDCHQIMLRAVEVYATATIGPI